MRAVLGVEDVRTFFEGFIVDFVLDCPPEEVHRWAHEFTAETLPWGGQRVSISIDMVKQFLMQRISMFRAQVLPCLILGPHIPCRVPAEHWDILELDDSATEIQKDDGIMQYQINGPNACNLLHR